MKRVMMCLLLGIFVLGFAIADSDNGNDDSGYDDEYDDNGYGYGVQYRDQERDATGEYHDEMIAAGGMNGSANAEQMEMREEMQERSGNPEMGVMNQGEDGQGAENKERVKVQVRIGNYSINSSLMLQNGSGNGSAYRAMLSNGRNVEIKVMPDVASETALARLRLRNCNESNNCTIELKEVGEGNETRAVYSVMAQKKSRLFGLFGANMDVEVEIDAETGEVISSSKPWWAFLASESDETEEEETIVGEEITNFEECAEAGNPVLESYPRQCTANGQTFVEEIEESSE